MTKTQNLQGVVADNVNRLMKTRDDTRTTLRLAKKAGVANGTIHRMRNAAVACNIDTLEAVAFVFGLEAWHLLIEAIDPADKPHLMYAREMALHAKLGTLMEELKDSGYRNLDTTAPPRGDVLVPRAAAKKSAFKQRKNR